MNGLGLSLFNEQEGIESRLDQTLGFLEPIAVCGQDEQDDHMVVEWMEYSAFGSLSSASERNDSITSHNKIF